MTFRETFYQVKGLMESRLHDFGLESADASTMGWTTMLSIEQNTRVTIDVPLILIYSDEFLISGTLETSTYSRLNGKTVKLKVGNTIVATTTTNINGEYSFTHTPVSTGNHSFQVIFEGTNIHTASQSSVVNRTVGKETSVINLDGISTQHYGDTVIFGGQLLDNDGQYISSASVKYYLNNSLVTTLTTDAQGRFSTSKSVDSFATQNIKFIYDGDSNYTNCEGSSQIDVYQPQLSLTSNKNILSYADDDSATLTVQVQDNAPVPQNLAISNHLVTLLGYDDSAATASDFTDTNSIASISDSGQTIVIHSNSTTSDSNVVYNTTFGAKSMLMSFNIDSAIISDAAYIVVLNAAGTLIGYLALSTGQYEIYAYNDANAIVVIKDGSILGSIQLNGASSYKVGFYLSETRIVLSDVQVHEIVDSGYTNSSGACTLTYNSQGLGDIVLTAQANISGTLLSKTYGIEDYLFVPKLDGTDSITKWTDIPNNTSAGVFSSHGSFLTNGWSNEGLWELDFDVQCTSWKYVGLMPVCNDAINPFTDAKASANAMTTWEGISYMGGMGFSSWDSADSMSKITNTTWHHITLTKLSPTKVKIVIDNTYTAIGNYDNLPNHSVLHIGSRDNPSARNNGGIVKYKNIIVKPL